jgi:hypothetical protein
MGVGVGTHKFEHISVRKALEDCYICYALAWDRERGLNCLPHSNEAKDSTLDLGVALERRFLANCCRLSLDQTTSTSLSQGAK